MTIVALSGADPSVFTPEVIRRFVSQIQVGDRGCWIWQLSTDRYGYGQFKIDGRSLSSHRTSYELFVGAVPEGLEIDHTCHTRDRACAGGSSCIHRRCVNPAHLEPVTHAENIRRRDAPLRPVSVREVPGQAEAKPGHCRAGHPFNEANTYIKPTGKRACRACNREAVARYAARRKESEAR